MGDTMREGFDVAEAAYRLNFAHAKAVDKVGCLRGGLAAAYELGRQLGMEQERALWELSRDGQDIEHGYVTMTSADYAAALEAARQSGMEQARREPAKTGDAVRQCGWIVFSAEIGSGALYNLNQRDAAFDAAKRWGACIQAVELAAGTPNVAAPSSQSAAHGIPTPPAGDSDTQS